MSTSNRTEPNERTTRWKGFLVLALRVGDRHVRVGQSPEYVVTTQGDATSRDLAEDALRDIVARNAGDWLRAFSLYDHSALMTYSDLDVIG
jgi:hypothetical protein